MPDLTIWVSGADFIEMGEFLAEDESKFGKFHGDVSTNRPTFG